MTPRTFLVIEDDLVYGWIVVRELGALAPAATIYLVETGREGLTFSTAGGQRDGGPTPSLIVLDHHLPDMRGTAMLRALVAAGRTLPPVLVLSQAVWPQDQAEMNDAGVGAFVRKPRKRSELRAILAAFLAENLTADGFQG